MFIGKGIPHSGRLWMKHSLTNAHCTEILGFSLYSGTLHAPPRKKVAVIFAR